MTAAARLRRPDLALVWSQVQLRLERNGGRAQGRVRLPVLSSEAQLAVASLMGGPAGKTIDLTKLEDALRRVEVGSDLAAALAALGHPISTAPDARRAARAASASARAAARARVATWDEPWADAWMDDVIRTGLLAGQSADGAAALTTDVRAILDLVERARPSPAISTTGRKQMAAHHFGSAHALDSGSRLERAATRALVHSLGDGTEREVWERAGFHLDQTSGATLTWCLPLRGDAPAVRLVAAAAAASVPVHLSRLAHDGDLTVPSGTPILVVENPHIVELAAVEGRRSALICGNGNPTGTTQELLRRLQRSGADLRYHGDFDSAGLGICHRMEQNGIRPWAMGETEYAAALADADHAQVALPEDDFPPGPTPWDPSLARRFDADRRIVHEERLLPGLLDRWEAEHRPTA